MQNTLERPQYHYLAPTYRQGKRIAWDYFKQFSQPIPGVKFNEAELRVDYPHGGRISIHGCDSPDSFRGVYSDGTVLDEFGLMPPTIFSEVVRPTLSDRKGWAIFIGTPKGQNAFHALYKKGQELKKWYTKIYKASETNIIDKEELDDAKESMSIEHYNQEYECSFIASVVGAYYSTQMSTMRSDQRVRPVPYQPEQLVETYWDIGIGDATVILFVQKIFNEVHIIDYYENTGGGLPAAIKYIKEKPYIYNRHVGPHDFSAREFGSGKNRIQLAKNLGIKITTAPKLPIDDGIEAGRVLLSRCYIDEVKCYPLIEALENYRKEYDEKNRVFRLKPLHDWSSHPADAFRTLAVALKSGIIEHKVTVESASNYDPLTYGMSNKPIILNPNQRNMSRFRAIQRREINN